MAFASIGIVMTAITAAVLWKYWDTPVVKACGRELRDKGSRNLFTLHATQS
jgi:hypothetical protein